MDSLRYSNWRYKRVGHLFQGPFRHVLVENDLHLFATLSYVFLNPIKARTARKPEDWKWSSYAATAGFVKCPKHLSIEWLKVLLPATSLHESQRRLRAIMAEPRPLVAYLEALERDASVDGALRSGRSFVTEARRMAVERLAARPSLDELIRRGWTDRARFIYELRVIHGYRIRDIARAMRMQPANVSRIFRTYLQSR